MYPLFRCVHIMSIVATREKNQQLQNAIAETHAKRFFASFTFGLLRLNSDMVALLFVTALIWVVPSYDCNRKSTNNSSSHTYKAFVQTYQQRVYFEHTHFFFWKMHRKKRTHSCSTVSFFSRIWTLEFWCAQYFALFLFSLAFFNWSWFPLWHLVKRKKTNQFVRL